MGVRKIAQFRYFGDNHREKNFLNNTNYPYNLSSSQFLPTLETNIFYQFNHKILQLRISALPGTKFNVNCNTDPLIVGASGVYEIDKTDNDVTIEERPPLYFEQETLDLIDKNPDGYLIIDIVYEEG